MYLFQPNTNHAEGTRPYLHKSMKQFITLICAGLLMNSCATIFCGSKTKVTFDGEISEKATLTIDGMKHTNVTFPYTTKIRRGFDETVVKIESPNYTAEPIIINKSFNAVSVINLLEFSAGVSTPRRAPSPNRNSNSIRLISNPKRRRHRIKSNSLRSVVFRPQPAGDISQSAEARRTAPRLCGLPFPATAEERTTTK